MCAHAYEQRYPAGHALRAAAAARLEEELRVIRSLGLSGFFLLHRDLLELAREVAVEVRGPSTARALLPPGRGRGSSVSSIVCYLTGLSHVDPVANDLLLGRFLNEELTALPDIDLDFPRDVREVLIPRVHERYGRDRSALVAAFPTFKARGAIREIGKALGLPPGEIERVARGSEGWGRPHATGGGGSAGVGRDIEVALGEHRRTGRWAWLAALSDEAYGLPRHLSQHSGGMIVATRPLVDCCPVVPAAMEGRQMVMWDKDSCADAGFLKIDLLGLGMLSAVERCVETIHARRGERIDLSRIPFDDAATFASIQEADTTGVFQIESRAQMGSLRRTRPETLEDLTIQVAIVRPGPIVGGAVNPYIERRQRLRVDPSFAVPYEHPSLEPVLRETLGTIIFQDQVLEVAQAFAGFSAGEAEGLRRAMSRKRSEAAIRAFHDRFVSGAMTRFGDVDTALAERVWTMVAGFSGFGFPRRTARRSGCWPTSRRGCASTTARSSCARCSTSSRWASTRPTPWPTRPSGGGSRCARPTSTPARPAAPSRSTRGRRGRCGSGWATSWACAPTRSGRSWRPASRTGPSPRSTTSPRARERGGRRSSSSRGRGRATGSWSPTPRGAGSGSRRGPRGGSRCGGWGSPHPRRPPGRAARRGRGGPRSSRCRWTCPRRRSSPRWTGGRR